MIICDNIIFELQKVGGVSKVWSKIIEVLDQENLNLKFLEGPSVHDNIFRKNLNLRHPSLNDKGNVQIRRILSSKNECDVFHSSYYRISSKAKKNIVTIHDFMNELYPTSLRDIALSNLKKRAIFNADKIIVVSNTTKKDLIAHYPCIDPGRIEVIFNGVDEEFYPEMLKEKFILKSHSFVPRKYFLYVGTRGHCKNFKYVIEFYRAAREEGYTIPLLVVGGGSFSKKELVWIRSMGVSIENIKHITGIDNEQLRLLYSNCLALLIPSIYEGFGLPALEGACCGALVLSSRGGALEEIVGETKFAFNLNLSNDFNRVIELGFDTKYASEERRRLIERSALFSWKRAAMRHRDIYDEYS